jgi:hypothetical protein
MTEERAEWVKKFAAEEARAREAGEVVIQADIPINVYLHTISSKESTLLSVRAYPSAFPLVNRHR